MAERKISCEVYADRGIVGPKGDNGSPNSLSIGTVESGETASATITGEAPSQTLNLVLPKGDKGDNGQDGAAGNGISSISKTSTSGLVDTYTITMTDGNSTTFDVTNGEDGADGTDGTDGADGQDGFSPSATVSKSGSVTTLTVTDKDGTTTATINDGEVSTSQLNSALALKQDTLVSGTNLKTINSNSLLGSGNIDIDSLPSQTGQSGKFLTTDGTDASWSNVDALPSQTGQSGKFLKTDGSAASWDNIPATVSADGTTIENNSNVLTTIAVKDQNTANADKIWTGTKIEYDAIVAKDSNTFYNITDDEVAADFANTSLSNLSDNGKMVAAKMSLPSDTYESLTLSTSGSEYTAPADGYIALGAQAASTTSYVYLNLKDKSFGVMSWVTIANNTVAAFIPVKAGDKFTAYYYSVSNATFRFYYTEGNKSEAN